MNSDNCLLSGRTMDYGPFGFVEQYEPLWSPFTSDAERKFGFERQPLAAQVKRSTGHTHTHTHTHTDREPQPRHTHKHTHTRQEQHPKLPNIYIHIYIYIHTHTYVNVYIYIYRYECASSLGDI